MTFYESAFRAALGLVERGQVPDAMTRSGIRSLLGQRAREVRHSPTPVGSTSDHPSGRRNVGSVEH